jgi:hypothetical protein
MNQNNVIQAASLFLVLNSSQGKLAACSVSMLPVPFTTCDTDAMCISGSTPCATAVGLCGNAGSGSGVAQ